jgi:hypothetical protein
MKDDNNYSLASSASATGAAVAIQGGTYVFIASGTVGGATISLQAQMPDGFWCDVAMYDASIVKTTALPYVMTGIKLPAGSVRAAVTGGAGVSLNASLVGIG